MKHRQPYHLTNLTAIVRAHGAQASSPAFGGQEQARTPARRAWLALLLALLAALALGGCFGGGEEQAPVDEVIRTPRPTFTPTPVQPTATPLPPTAPPAASGAGGAPGDPLQVPADAPVGVVNSEQVNARKAPNITSDNIIRELARGDEFRIIGKAGDDEWWYVCCVDNATAWVYYSYLDVSGPVDGVPVSDAIGGLAAETGAQASAPAAPTAPPADTPTSPPPAPATDTPAPVAEVPVQAPAAPADTPTVEQPALPTDTPAPAFPFQLVAQEQFVETNNLVRVFAYIYQGTTALSGYTLRISKDGAEMPVSGSSADTAGFTWPVANPRQRFQNLKVEFPNVQAGGTWQIQLVDGGGQPAGPPATFTLSANDENRELYVRYEKP